MNSFIRIFFDASKLLTGDSTVYRILLRSLFINGMATAAAAACAIPLALMVDATRFRGKNAAITMMQTLTGVPPVAVGLIVYLFLSRNGPLADLDLLFTRSAMIAAQVLIAFPIIFTISHSHFAKVDERIRLLARTLGACDFQVALKVFWEAVNGSITAVMTAFGRVVGEVGAVMLVGGNIQGRTRIMTTAIVLDTSKGDFERAVALGIILVAVAFLVNFLTVYFSRLFLRGEA